jgi:transcriptional regulator with XRE-family HTH domain
MGDHAISLELGNNLRSLRLQHNLSQEKLAEKAGLSRSAISEMENGKTATSLVTIIQVLRALQQLHLLEHLLINDESGLSETAGLSKAERPRASRSTASYKSYNKKSKEEDESDWLL